MNIGENIKKYRKESGLTQKELADKLGIPASTLGNYEVSKREPKIELLYKVADAIGVSVVDLFNIDICKSDIYKQAKIQCDKQMEEYENELAQFLKIKEEELMLAIRYSKYSEINQTKEFLRGVVSGLNIAFDILKEEKADDKSRKDF